MELLDLIKKTDTKLASQFVVESMSNLEYEPYSNFSDNSLESMLQRQYSHYCLMAKSNLVMDTIGQGNPFIVALKKHIKKFIADQSNSTNPAMKYLYELDDMDMLIQQIGMLTMHANIKRVKDIRNISDQEFKAALNPEQVALSLGLYTYFTILVNDNITVNEFNELFVESWIKYYENFQARVFLFQMRGNSWKNDFKGVLLDD